jgi:hypothetical protein
MSSPGGLCWTDAKRVGSRLPLAALLTLLLLALGGGVGCGREPRFYGLVLQVSGDHNNWSQDESTPTLRWDATLGAYRGVVSLPGDRIALQLSAPRTDVFFGALPDESGSDAGVQPVPATLATMALGVDEVRMLQPFRLATPVSARYELTFAPQAGRLRVDLASDAETDLPPATALLVTALRGADRQPIAEQQRRADVLEQGLRSLATETPLPSSTGPMARFPALTFVDFDRAPVHTVSLVGDWNGWTAGVDPLYPQLAGRLRLRAMRVPATRVEYLFDRDGVRHVDDLNLEVAWAGMTLPQNPDNLLGGNLGELRSVAWEPGRSESGPRLRRLPLPLGSLASFGLGEVLIGLPAGYVQHPDARYPSIYIHDGKDALVRGRYDRLLYALAENGQAPPTVAVYLPAPTGASARLSLYSHYPDPRFPEVLPRGSEYAKYILDVVVPAVDKSYRTGNTRAMLGIDMAGPFCFELAWLDPQARFSRLISQSGRFGWGEDPQTRERPYFKTLSTDRSSQLVRAAFDWTDGDLYQVQATDGLRPLFATSGYAGKLQFYRQLGQGLDFWESLRQRALGSLSFALSDIISPTGMPVAAVQEAAR